MKHILQFDDYTHVSGTVELEFNKSKCEISIILGENKTKILEASGDQWGVFYFINDQTISQEDETRSFIDALIKSLVEMKRLMEFETKESTLIEFTTKEL